jgi:hypothetical protein
MQIDLIKSELNPEQNAVFTFLMKLLEPEKVEGEEKQRLVMLHGEAGTGKTFLYQKLKDACEKLVRIYNLNYYFYYIRIYRSLCVHRRAWRLPISREVQPHTAPLACQYAAPAGTSQKSLDSLVNF